MAPPSTIDDFRPAPSSPLGDDRTLGAVLEQFRKHPLTTPLEMVSFWLAVALPFLYLPLLVTGVGTDGEVLSVLVLVAANVVALLVGHGYRNEKRSN